MKTPRSLRTAAMLLAVLSLLVGALPPPALAAAGPTDIPAPLPAGSPTATVNLSATSGTITQLITVSGQTNTPAAGVRVMWVYNDAGQTVTAAVVNTTGSSYSAQVSVPLPAPQAVGVQESPLYEASLAIQWLPLAVPGVAGYRILRGTQPGGPYELAGEATGVVFNDLPLPRGRTFYYVVQAYDAAGVVSGFSQEVSGALPRLSTYLPAILR